MNFLLAWSTFLAQGSEFFLTFIYRDLVCRVLILCMILLIGYDDQYSPVMWSVIVLFIRKNNHLNALKYQEIRHLKCFLITSLRQVQLLYLQHHMYFFLCCVIIWFRIVFPTFFIWWLMMLELLWQSWSGWNHQWFTCRQNYHSI